jgi:hypothetical protein
LLGETGDGEGAATRGHGPGAVEIGQWGGAPAVEEGCEWSNH